MYNKISCSWDGILYRKKGIGEGGGVGLVTGSTYIGCLHKREAPTEIDGVQLVIVNFSML